jgi:glycosyltransferase involved in cell wall biosynthesis
VIERKIAVLICVWRADRADQFGLALRSALHQTPDPGQIRVYLGVDGPVPPEIDAVIDAFEGRIHRTLRNETNRGLARTLNRLIDLLEDEDYVVRIDADDVNAPDRMIRQIEMLEDDPTLDLIGCQANDIDRSGQIVGRRDYPLDHASIVRAMRYLNPVAHPGWAVRRRVFDELGLRYRPVHLTEDLDFLMQLVDAGGRLGNAPGRLLSIRFNDDFFRRRTSTRRGLTELRLYTAWTLRQDGLLSSAWPAVFGRFLLRLVPGRLASALYRSSLRARFVGRVEPAVALASHGAGHAGHGRQQIGNGGNLYRKVDRRVQSDQQHR